MDNGEQGKNKIIPHSVLMRVGGRGMKRRVAFGQKNGKRKACTLLLDFLCSFFLSSINPSLKFVFSSKNTHLQSTYTHEKRARSWKRKPRSKEGRKEEIKTNGFYFFLLILIRERKKERKPQESRIYVSRGKGQKTPEYI
jgi:hypothetical protein